MTLGHTSSAPARIYVVAAIIASATLAAACGADTSGQAAPVALVAQPAPAPAQATTTSRDPAREAATAARGVAKPAASAHRTSKSAPAPAGANADAKRTTTGAAPAAPAQIYLGALGDVDGLSASISHPLARHVYGSFGRAVPNARMITVWPTGTWGQFADVRPGSREYTDVVRWADTLKARRTRTLLAFSHEPETALRTHFGTSADYVRGYRKMVSIFRSRGVANVSYTWQMTAWAFRAPASDRQAATRWYPGDAYVDIVGADAYNWYTCGAGHDRWVELSTLAAPVLTFAQAHGKKAALPEFASYVGPQRDTWVANAHTYLAANRGKIVAAFYFNRGPTNPANQDCVWSLNRADEFAEYGRMARDGAFVQ
jgi:hypothetical protein